MSILGDRNGSLQDAKITENLEQDLEVHSGENPEENVTAEYPDNSIGGINDSNGSEKVDDAVIKEVVDSTESSQKGELKDEPQGITIDKKSKGAAPLSSSQAKGPNPKVRIIMSILDIAPSCHLERYVILTHE